MNNIYRLTNIIKPNIRSLYFSNSNLNNYICHLCNKQINPIKKQNNTKVYKPPSKNKIDRNIELYPDLKGHVDRF